MYKLKIISSSVRPGRKGPLIASWIADEARSTGLYEVEVIDLGEQNLPLMNEPAHPRLKQYTHEHTRQWSQKIEEADALVFVTAEYNFGYPAALRNALEYLFLEWQYKAAGIVSYGGVSAGTRAYNSLKADLSSLKAVGLTEAVNIPMFTQFINDEGVLTPNESMQRSAQNMLKELARWTKGLKLIKADQ